MRKQRAVPESTGSLFLGSGVTAEKAPPVPTSRGAECSAPPSAHRDETCTARWRPSAAPASPASAPLGRTAWGEPLPCGNSLPSQGDTLRGAEESAFRALRDVQEPCQVSKRDGHPYPQRKSEGRTRTQAGQGPGGRPSGPLLAPGTPPGAAQFPTCRGGSERSAVPHEDHTSHVSKEFTCQ